MESPGKAGQKGELNYAAGVSAAASIRIVDLSTYDTKSGGNERANTRGEPFTPWVRALVVFCENFALPSYTG